VNLLALVTLHKQNKITYRVGEFVSKSFDSDSFPNLPMVVASPVVVGGALLAGTGMTKRTLLVGLRSPYTR